MRLFIVFVLATVTLCQTITTFVGYPGIGEGDYALNVPFVTPASVASDNVNNLIYFTDSSNNLVRVVNKTSGILTTFAGTGETNHLIITVL